MTLTDKVLEIRRNRPPSPGKGRPQVPRALRKCHTTISLSPYQRYVLDKTRGKGVSPDISSLIEDVARRHGITVEQFEQDPEKEKYLIGIIR